MNKFIDKIKCVINKKVEENKMTKKMPVLFLAHGSPMNVILDNDYTRDLINFGKKLKSEIDKPKAILVISAHWYTRGSYLTYSDKPKQIYDFSGFPEEIYKIKYEAEGAKEVAREVAEALSDFDVKLTEDWGLDHGSWGVLKFIYEDAEIPVFQLSIDGEKSTQDYYNMGKTLRKFREEGILIIGSGDTVHSFRGASFDEMYGEGHVWAQEFDNHIKDALINDKHEKIINYKDLGEIAELSVPSEEHYAPMVYVAGLKEEGDKIDIFHDSIQNKSISMMCVKIG